MKSRITFIIIGLILGVISTTKSQTYKAKYINYKSETKNELEGSTLAIYKYENSLLTMSKARKELLFTKTKDAVMMKLFNKIPWNNDIKTYASGMNVEDKGQNIGYYVQADVSTDLKQIKFSTFSRDKVTNKVLDNVTIIFIKIK